MRIKTKLYLFLITSLFLIIIASSVSFFLTEDLGKQIDKNILTDKIIKNVGELRLLTFDYLSHPEERAKVQWNQKHIYITNFLKNVQFKNNEDSVIAREMEKNNNQMGDLFSQITRPSTSSGFKDILSEQLLLDSQEIISDAFSLSDRSNSEITQAKTNERISFSLILLILALVIIISSLIVYKDILNSLTNLQKGIDIIGKGDFNYKIPIRKKDEIGDITNSFNEMTIKVKNSYQNLENAKQELVKFQMAVEDASDQIVISDPNGIVLYGNKATEKITGYTIKQTLGKKAGSLWGGHMDAAFYKNMWSVIKAGKTFIGEINNKRKNGEPYMTETHISPVVDEQKNILFFVSIERDISKLKEIDREKSEFVSVASHALRTPLGIEKWYLEAMIKKEYLKKSPKAARDYLDQIYSSNERLLILVRDLLNVSRIDQGKMKDNPKDIDVLTVVKNVIKEMKIQANKTDIEIVLTDLTKEEINLFIDPLKLHEVIENLIANAIKYSNTHGKIEVIFDKKDNAIIISVKDSGIGISLKDQKNLFKKFFRAENATIKNTEGSGLGLYTVKYYVEGWGGKISVESKEEKGSTFTLTLPGKITSKKIANGEEVKT